MSDGAREDIFTAKRTEQYNYSQALGLRGHGRVKFDIIAIEITYDFSPTLL